LTAVALAPPPPSAPLSIEPAEIESSYVGYRNMPFADAALAYEIGIPRTYRDETEFPSVKESYDEPVVLGRWVFEAIPGASIEVSYFVLPVWIAPMRWLEAAAEAHGFEIVELQTRTADGRQFGDMLARVGSAPEVRVVRVAAFVDGERLFLVTGSAPESGYANHADGFAGAIQTFRVVQPHAFPSFEVVPYRVEGPFSALLTVPRGWVIQGARGLQPHNGLAFIRPSPAGAEPILIRVHLAAPALDWGEMAVYLHALRAARAAGFIPARSLFDAPVSAPAALSGRLSLIEGQDSARGSTMELRIYTFSSRNGRVTISALGPGHTVAPESWRWCCAAVEAVVAGLEILE
jgi:hypothetical protein